jgi:plastocyanin
MSSRKLIWAPTFALALTVAACGGGSSDDAAPAAEAQAAAIAVDPAMAATITGSIRFEGEAAAAVAIRMNADPVCVKEGKDTKTETLVVSADGGLANVLVYLKEGVTGSYPAPSTPVVLDQTGCHYVPHVFGIQVGQPLQVINSDPTLHNIHAIPKVNQEFNTGQPIKGMKFDHTFSAMEVMVPFKCDVHGWMNAHAAVLDHPFFAVTSTDGTFEITGLPPGSYTVEAVHEKLGTQTMTVEVAAKDSKAADFSFTAAS